MTLFDDEVELQTPAMPKRVNVLKREAKRQFINAMKKEEVEKFLTFLPQEGETLHIVANGKFDFWSFIPVIIELMGGKTAAFYGSTWTLNRENCHEMLKLYDEGKVSGLNILTGLYFKQRESAVYATLLNGILDRRQRYKCLENHAKVALLSNGTDYITIEGSANFTANPRVEQYAISNGRDLHDFHKVWMDDILR
jgi:hypothetical protein